MIYTSGDFNWLKKRLKTCLQVKKIHCFVYIYKMYLISTEGYINAGIHLLRVRKTDEIWVNMKNVHDSLCVKNVV